MPRKPPADFDPEEFGRAPEDEGTPGLPPADGDGPGTRRLWSPRPVSEPSIDPAFRCLGWWERSAEIIRFTLLRLEHWLSREGNLREWVRLNLWTAVVLAAAAVLVVPPLTAVLEGAAEFTGIFGRIVGNMTETALKLPPVVLGIATLVLVSRLLLRHWRGRRRGGYGQHDLDGYQ